LRRRRIPLILGPEEARGMATSDRRFARLEGSKSVESPPGITRTALAWNAETMLCHFRMKRGARIPLHHHPAAQNGYVVRGRVRFLRGDGTSFEATAGTGYCFGPEEPHGAEVIDDSEVIECFAPMRTEYAEAGGDAR
jgi:quercetin dioxygenase-like cupin family protein